MFHLNMIIIFRKIFVSLARRLQPTVCGLKFYDAQIYFIDRQIALPAGDSVFYCTERSLA